MTIAVLSAIFAGLAVVAGVWAAIEGRATRHDAEIIERRNVSASRREQLERVMALVVRYQDVVMHETNGGPVPRGYTHTNIPPRSSSYEPL